MKFLSKKIFLALGCTLFLITKTCLVGIPIFSLSSPRLGDDSLVYLWKGALALNPELNYSKAIVQIKEQRFIDDESDSSIQWERSNTAQRTIGTGTEFLFHQLIAGISKKITPNSAIAFFTTEILGVFLMLWGIHTFTKTITNIRTAGITLIIFATSVFPNQGINNFIPGTYALSLGFLLWGYVIKNGDKINPWIYLLLTGLISLTHPIGKIYIFLALTLSLFSPNKLTKTKILVLAFISILSIYLPILIGHLFPEIQRPPSEITGGISLAIHTFSYNLEGSSTVIKELVKKNISITLLLFFAAWKYRIFSHTQIRLIVIFFGTLLVTLLHHLPGYPAELFSRLLPIFALVVCALTIKNFPYCYKNSGAIKQKIFMGIGLGIVLHSYFSWFYSYIPYTINQRDEVINEKFLREKLQKINTNEILLYAETTYSLPISLLNGGENFSTIAYPMLGKSSKEYIEKYKPSYIILPVAKALNSLSTTRTKNFELRSSNIDMRYVKSFQLKLTSQPRILSLLIESDLKDDYILQYLDGDTNHKVKVSQGITSYQLPINGLNIIFFGPPEKVKILGINVNEKQLSDWPWGEDLNLSYQERVKNKSYNVDFSIEGLMRLNNTSDLAKYINRNSLNIEDQSGLIFIKTIYKN